MTPRELRTLAVQARHCDVPTIADALERAAARIEALEGGVGRLAAALRVFLSEDEQFAEQVWRDGGGCRCPNCENARAALREVGR